MAADHAGESGTRRFVESLIEQHLDEAAFLYEQRTVATRDIDADWTRKASVESRLEAHLDALVQAGAAALDGAVARLADGTPGAAFTAASLCGRLQSWPMLLQVLDGVDVADPLVAAAVRDALYVDMPAGWHPQVAKELDSATSAWLPMWLNLCGSQAKELDSATSAWLPMWLNLCGSRRLGLAPQIRAVLRQRIATAAAASALGRLRATSAVEELQACLGDDDAQVRRAAVAALCRLGDGAAAEQVLRAIGSAPWVRDAAGIAGGAQCVAKLEVQVRNGNADLGTVQALGLLGDPGSVPALHALLDDPGLAAAAARALHWITGAPLFEQRFIPDEVDEMSMTADELARWRDGGQAPARSDGQPFGTTVMQLDTSPDAWRQWLRAHASGFQRGLPYRKGRPWALSSVPALLAAPDTDELLRMAVVDELAVRYACTVPFETDLPVAVQRRLLNRLAHWVSGTAAQFPPGSWYFNGSRCTT